MPARPFRMLDRAFRLTPSARAASVTVKFRGSRHSALSTSPGCGGLCIFIVTSMIVPVVYAIYVLPYTSERNAPVAARLLQPMCPFGGAEFVEIQTGQVHIACTR